MLSSWNGTTQVNKVPNLQKFDYAPYHFGFVLAMNQMFFTVKPVPGIDTVWFPKSAIPDREESDAARVDSIAHKYYPGFTIGIVSNLRLGEYFDLRLIPSLAFGERDLIYYVERNNTYKDPGVFFMDTINKKIYSTLVEVPLHLKYKAMRLQNSRIYVLGGVMYTLDLAKESKRMKDSSTNKHVKLNKSDLLGEAGVGCDFYTAYFKFGIELKMSYGLFNIIEREGNLYTESIDQLRSKMFQLSFTFE